MPSKVKKSNEKKGKKRQQNQKKREKTSEQILHTDLHQPDNLLVQIRKAHACDHTIAPDTIFFSSA